VTRAIRKGAALPGIPDFTGLWTRSISQHQRGGDLKPITSVLSGDERVTEYQPSGNVVPIENDGDAATDAMRKVKTHAKRRLRHSLAHGHHSVVGQ